MGHCLFQHPANATQEALNVRRQDRNPRRLNGPYRVTGPVKVVDADGKELELPSEMFSMCRCGHSETKPFCDGTHKKIAFQAENPRPERLTPGHPTPRPSPV